MVELYRFCLHTRSRFVDRVDYPVDVYLGADQACYFDKRGRIVVSPSMPYPNIWLWGQRKIGRVLIE